MATTVLAFKDSMTETERLRAGQETAKLHTAAERKTALNGMADGFESKIGRLVETLSAGSMELEATARSVTGTANRSNTQAVSVAAAAEQARTGLHTVASAADELPPLSARSPARSRSRRRSPVKRWTAPSAPMPSCAHSPPERRKLAPSSA
jgi:hypothetical protein